MDGTLVLFQTHLWRRELGERFLRLWRETAGVVECRLLLQDDAGPVAGGWRRFLAAHAPGAKVETFDPERLEIDLGYPFQNGRSLTPGSTHYALLALARARPRERFWVVESDVEYSGSWRDFFVQFARSDADLLVSHVRTRDDHPEWGWWSSLAPPEGEERDGNAQLYRAFFPVYRISRGALAALDGLHRQGWRGHYEVLTPTLLRCAGFEVRDLRALADCYRGDKQDPNSDAGQLSTMRWRPGIALHELARATAKPCLLHPVKTGVSIVLATHNGARYLPAQLRSLEAQTRRPDELIVVDDASSDGTADLLRRFADASKLNIQLLRQERRMGYSANFIDGTSRTTGALVLFCDQDDIWHKEKVARIGEAAERSDAGVFTHDITIFAAQARRPSFFVYLESVGFGPWACIKGHALAVRRSFLLKWGPPPAGTFSYDLWFALLATLSGRRAYVRTPLVAHRLHGGNASGWIPAPRDLRHIRPEQLGQELSDAELLLDLCVKEDLASCVALLEAALTKNLAETDPARLASAQKTLAKFTAANSGVCN